MSTSHILSRSNAIKACAAIAIVAAGLPQAGLANPTGGTVASGAASIVNTTPSQLDINQSTNKAIINWDTFNIAPNETTNFNQPGASSVTLNRIGDQNPSQILGNLNANGQLMLVNPNGMMFGRNANVNVGSLVATTADLTNEDFNNGVYNFSKAGKANASITNNGTITAANNGFTALVAPTVTNNGTITAQAGKVALGGGDVFTLDTYGDKLVNFALPEGVERSGPKANAATVNQNGTIYADQGSVLLTANAAKNVVDATINMDGVVQARGSAEKGGVITLEGDNVNIGGTLDAAGATDGKGGTVTATAKKKLTFSGEALASAGEGAEAGNIALTGNKLALGGTTQNTGGTTKFTAGNTFDVDGAAAYTIGNSMETAANTEIAAKKTINVNSGIDTSAQTNEGALKLADADADGKLTVNLDGKITQGEGQSLSGDANKVTVKSNGSIQNGVDVSHADGSVISVNQGTYAEDVNIDRDNITLNGTNVGKRSTQARVGEAVIDGDVAIRGAGNTVDGFTVNGGVAATNAENVKISNNIINGASSEAMAMLAEPEATTGIHVVNSDGATVHGNGVTGVDTGIWSQGSDNIKVSYNNVTAENGLVLNNSDGARIEANTLSGAADPETEAAHGDTGISLVNSDGANMLFNKVRNYSTGIEARGSDGSQLSNNQVSANKGLVLRNSNNTMVTGSSFTGIPTVEGAEADATTGATGVTLVNADNTHFQYSKVRNYDTGIDVRDSDGTRLNNNEVRATNGIALRNSDNARVEGNVVDAVPATAGPEDEVVQGGTGIFVANSDNANVLYNKVRNYDTGIEARNTSGLQLNTNTLTNTDNGIVIRQSDGAIASGNTIAGNSGEGSVGLGLYNSDDARVLNNTVRYYDTGVASNNSEDAYVYGNWVHQVNNGMNFNHADGLEVSSNKLVGKAGSTGTGITVRNTDGADISVGNNISGFPESVRVVNSTGVVQ